MIRSFARGLVLVVLVSAGFNRFPLGAQAAPLAGPIFIVNSNSDVHGAGTGLCQTTPTNNVCTLRAAVEAANKLASGGATIIVPALPPGGLYILQMGPLNPTKAMTIVGGGAAGTIIDGNQQNRVFTIGAAVTMAGVTVQNGRLVNNTGGGVFIQAGGALTLSESVVSHNGVAATTQNVSGGGISNVGSLTLVDSLVSNNFAFGSLTQTVSALGGGIANYRDMTLLSDTVELNQASASLGYILGGGIYNTNTTDFVLAHQSVIKNTTVSGNIADGDGGAIYHIGDALYFASLVLVNSTVSGNFAGASGAGIDNQSNTAGVQLFNVTVSDNVAQTSGGGLETISSGYTQFKDSLISFNRLGTGEYIPGDCHGTLFSLGYNLISSTAGCMVTGTTTGNLLEQFAHLHLLGNNGGPTLTLALYPDSPGVDAGDPAGCTDNVGAPLATDQRGYPRTANGAGATVCDMGAYELQRTLDLPLVVR